MRSYSRLVLRTFLTSCCLATFLLSPALAVDVVSIEEHWELKLGEPDAERSAPQVSMTMSPTNHFNGTHFIFTLNHHSAPDFKAGGIQAQQWNGETLVASGDGPRRDVLWHTGETISWTQRLTQSGSSLVFEVVNGQSQTWGTFGGNGYLRFSTSAPEPNLNNYQPGISMTESGVGYAGNRVSSLTLKRLRWTTSDGQVHELHAPIDIDTDIDP